MAGRVAPPKAKKAPTPKKAVSTGMERVDATELGLGSVECRSKFIRRVDRTARARAQSRAICFACGLCRKCLEYDSVLLMAAYSKLLLVTRKAG